MPDSRNGLARRVRSLPQNVVRRFTGSRRARERWIAYDRLWDEHLGLHALLLERLLKESTVRRARSIFSIGPGSGRVEIDLMTHGGATLGFAEADPYMASRLAMRANSAGVSDRIDVRQERFDPSTLTHRFDLLLSINSWYDFRDDPEMLTSALGLVEPGGSMIVVLGSTTDVLVDTGLLGPTLTGDVFGQRLDFDRVPYQRDVIEETLPTSVLVREHSLTAAGHDLATFLLGGVAGRQGRAALERRIIESLDGDTFERRHDVFVIPA